MRHPPRHARLAALAAVLAVAALLAACGSDRVSTTPEEDASPELSVHVASYDVATTGPQRFLVGLTTVDQGLVVGGTIELRFRRLADQPGDDGAFSSPQRAVFTPVADYPPADGDEPHISSGNETSGVYEAQGVTFDAAGTWEVATSVTVDGRTLDAAAAFPVSPAHQVPAAGQAALRSIQALPGAAGVAPTAIESRAEADGTIPDPQLHDVTIDAAIARGRPTLVVISTPVYCVSRFCGPITDVVADLATRYAGKASFVHLEVWADFEANAINPAPEEWIVTPDGGNEPWVFLIDGNGTIVRRWDNVANAADLEAALTTELADAG